MSITIEELLHEILPETREMVVRAKRRHNDQIRRMVRQETGLRISPSHNIKIYITTGVPVTLEEYKFTEEYRRAILISRWRTEIISFEDLSKRSISWFDGLSDNNKEILDSTRRKIYDPLRSGNRLADDLLKESALVGLIERLYSFDDHILGHYQPEDKQGGITASIHLYWGIIGLVAGLLGVTVEALTIIVLAHELAHAYTHLGADIDGHKWDTFSFMNTDKAVREGLAQYYTKQIVRKLKQDQNMPDPEEAYTELLSLQPKEYNVQETWVDAKYTAEDIRLAMIKFRRDSEAISINKFENLLEQNRFNTTK